VDDELRKRRVELSVGERQLLRGRPPHVNAGMALAGGVDELLRWIHGGDVRRADALHELARQRSGATADVDHTLSRAHAGHIGQLRRQQDGVPPHEAVIGLCSDGESHRRTLDVRQRGRKNTHSRLVH
jgi:hypothetical protein